MNLKKVYIYSNMTARAAQDKINAMLEEYDGTDMTINFDLKIESTVTVGKHNETKYTLVVYCYDLSFFKDDYEDYGDLRSE